MIDNPVEQTKNVMPLVSVILTSYNYEQYLPEAVQSIFEQTYKKIELIIVDDGSSDNSREIIDASIQSSPIPAEAIYKENGGQASAINAGLDRVKGEVVCLIDSDDYWHSNKIERMIAFMGFFPDGALYQHQMKTSTGKYKKDLLVNGDIYQLWSSLESINIRSQGRLIDLFVPTSGLVWRKEILDKITPIPDSLITCPDAFLTRASIIYGPLYSCPDVLGVWRDHPMNAGKHKANFFKYWVPTVMPAINTFYTEHQIPIKLTYRYDIMNNLLNWLTPPLAWLFLGQLKRLILKTFFPKQEDDN